jgi:hypothetical protein
MATRMTGNHATQRHNFAAPQKARYPYFNDMAQTPAI